MTITGDIRTERPWRRVLGRGLAAGGAAAGTGCLVGPVLAERSGLLVLTTAFTYRWPSFLVAALLLGGAALLLTERAGLRAGLLTACGAAAVGAVAFRLVVFPMLGGVWEEVHRAAAPGGADRYLVVEEGSAVIDPLWRVSVVDGSGLGAHHWDVGFFDGDATALLAVAWSGPDTLVVTAAGREEMTVRLDPRTGKPEREISVT
ncbi:hypothetical protein ACH4ZU_05590 [Streptomyces sp. NPDC020472]|uniref:hypothetical protein n=1 Tax=Streptomyces sp. NPDC020472 TaxID=3365075 RepID=UPI0037AC1C0B